MMESEANHASLKNLTDLDVAEINTVIVTRSHQVWIIKLDDEWGLGPIHPKRRSFYEITEAR
jgi:hypothetical protein